MPKKSELPDETKTWLVSTKAIQSDHILIKHKARQLKRWSFGNVIKLADNIVRFTVFHKPIWSFINVFILKIGTGAQDALNALYFGSVCTGAANLGTALFRANGVPAKDLIVMPTVNSWLQMHFISEYYCPGYGWVLAETSFIITPHQSKNNIILRVNYPEDENIAGEQHYGVEQWDWIDPKIPVWVSTVPWFEESGSRAWIETELVTDEQSANLAFNVTQEVYELHTRYLGVNLIGDSLTHFDNAINAQKNAIECFKQSDINGYLDNITIAYNEYQEIQYP
jgi:hypothetical protein